MSDDSSKAPSPSSKSGPSTKSGDGIRSIRTTNLFQIVNFELYAKPNLVIMGIGLTCLAFSTAYLAYLRSEMSENKTYVAIRDDGSQTLMERKSKWV